MKEGAAATETGGDGGRRKRAAAERDLERGEANHTKIQDETRTSNHYKTLYKFGFWSKNHSAVHYPFTGGVM